ncbi:MAG: sodium:proton antiporter [Tannerellaceae bacterium]|jgi:NhaC family Na+:H+ antiporter|nr:sodium:proton antiporter [Tannerellaceae bacterium]
MEERAVRQPSVLWSLMPVAVLVSLLFFTIRTFGSNALGGGSQIVLLASTAVCILVARFHCRVKWQAIEEAIAGNITGVSTALLILLLIGALSGSWMVSGVVPTLIYYGMQLIHPSVYLASTCVICAIVSMITGSSWTTIATIGIALLGIGQAQGYDSGWIAGAIVSGAYFGDKVSPLSDTTVLASSVTGTPIFTHIRYLMITTVPSMAISLVIFLVAGLLHDAPGTEQMTGYAASLKQTFHISPWLLVVPGITGILIAKRVPALATLFLAAVLAGVFALFFQPGILDTIGGSDAEGLTARFKGLLIAFYGTTQIETGHAALNELVATRGMGGMMDTIWLILCAMSFGGAMAAGGMLGSIISVFLRFMRRTAGMVASTVVSGLFFNIATADQYISIMLTGSMFKDIYRDRGYETRLLGRTIEDAVTVTSPLVPWNTCGMTQSTILGVSTFTYLPYCFFNLLSPLMSIFVASLGYKIHRQLNSNP